MSLFGRYLFLIVRVEIYGRMPVTGQETLMEAKQEAIKGWADKEERARLQEEQRWQELIDEFLQVCTAAARCRTGRA